jgi:L-asparaginase II
VDPLSVVVRRGDVVEAVHLVHVASTESVLHGKNVVSHLRSSAKPIQAIPLADAYDDLDDDELAIACASHQAEPAQLDAVRKLLARAGATVDDLECGPQEGRPEGKLGHNCSGKHAGFLAVCRANGWPFAGYRLLEHPVQQRIRELLGGDGMPCAIDGCGIPTYALALTAQAALLTRTPERIANAMRARPDLVGGDGADDTALMRILPGWIAKRGAEGCSARRRRTAAASPSRSPTATAGRFGRRSRPCWASRSLRGCRSKTAVARSSARSSSARRRP